MLAGTLACDGATYAIRPLAGADVAEVLIWRFPGPWSAHDKDADDVAELAGSDSSYRGLHGPPGGLVGYFCTGGDARAPGGDYRTPALDFGIVIRPDLLGQRLGPRLATDLLRALAAEAGVGRLRFTIGVWNTRARKGAARIGFRTTGTFGGFRRAPGGPWVVMEADVAELLTP